jgi:hypothetical protein
LPPLDELELLDDELLDELELDEEELLEELEELELDVLVLEELVEDELLEELELLLDDVVFPGPPQAVTARHTKNGRPQRAIRVEVSVFIGMSEGYCRFLVQHPRLYPLQQKILCPSS